MAAEEQLVAETAVDATIAAAPMVEEPLAEEPIHEEAAPDAPPAGLEPEAPAAAALEPEPQVPPRWEARQEPEPWLFDDAAKETPEVEREERPAFPSRPVAPREPSPIPDVVPEGIPEPDGGRRPTMVSFAAVALVFLVAGFLAGYGIGSRQPRQLTTTASAPAAPQPAPQPPQREWSEAAVETPPPSKPVVAPPSAPPVATESAELPAVRAPALIAVMTWILALVIPSPLWWPRWVTR